MLNGMVPVTHGDHSRSRKKFPTVTGKCPMMIGKWSREVTGVARLVADGYGGREKSRTDWEVTDDDRKVVPESYRCGQTGCGRLRMPGKSGKVSVVTCT